MKMPKNQLYIPHENTIIQHLQTKQKKLRIPQKEIADTLNLNQANISKLLRGQRRLRYEEAYQILQLIHQKTTTLPNNTLNELGISEVVCVYSDESTAKAASEMQKSGFTQIPVIDRKTGQCTGLVTDLTLLVRMLEPLKSEPKETWLKHLAELPISEAEVIDKVPEYPACSPLIEVAEGLMHHYGVLIRDEQKNKFGIITRADFLKLLTKQL
jgi:predicted transcriptional regulator